MRFHAGMYDLNHWLVFFAAALALNISPGPDIGNIVSNTELTDALRRNPRIGLYLDRTLGTVLIGLGVRLRCNSGRSPPQLPGRPLSVVALEQNMNYTVR